MSRRIIGSALVALLVGAFLMAGFWQLDRLGERRALNKLLLSRGQDPVVDTASLGSARDLPYRRARVTGTYDTAREFLLLSRSMNGLSGHHVVTPLVFEEGRAVLVDRGWVPLTFDTPPVPEAAPPTGAVVVQGVRVPDQKRGRFGPRPVEEKPFPGTFRIDVSLLRAHFPYELVDGFVQLEGQDPAQNQHPKPAPFPPLGEGPHLAYAIQWFLFATAAITGYAVLNRRRADSQVR